jgi:putative tricarboxylic transport membrane protein
MRTYPVCDIFLILFAGLVCVGSRRLGYGSFSDPGAGFMPLLSGLLLGFLALADLASGVITRWKEDRKDAELWADIDWGRLLTTIIVLLVYLIIMPRIGFSLPTFVLLMILFRVIEPRPWWFVVLLSLATTLAFYLGFQVALGVELPAGILGF